MIKFNYVIMKLDVSHVFAIDAVKLIIIDAQRIFILAFVYEKTISVEFHTPILLLFLRI